MSNDYYNWVPELGEADYEEQQALLAEVADEAPLALSMPAWCQGDVELAEMDKLESRYAGCI